MQIVYKTNKKYYEISTLYECDDYQLFFLLFEVWSIINTELLTKSFERKKRRIKGLKRQNMQSISVLKEREMMIECKYLVQCASSALQQQQQQNYKFLFYLNSIL